MHDVVRMPPAELKELFALTAKQMSMSPGIVEKDFWVVWTLDYLFARSPWRTQLAFKGGTSLSKQVLPVQLGALRVGDGGGDFAHAARTRAGSFRS